MGRIHQDRVMLDMRTVFDEEVESVCRVLDAAVRLGG
jgi:hypothetical protein